LARRATIMNSGRAGIGNRVCAPAFRRAARESGSATKNAKTTPCTVAGRCRIKDLRRFSCFGHCEIRVDTSGKTRAEWHHRDNRERRGYSSLGGVDLISRKPFIHI
jgi:hypothetical protein